MAFKREFTVIQIQWLLRSVKWKTKKKRTILSKENRIGCYFFVSLMYEWKT